MAAARAALICSLATAPVMGTTVNQRAAMVVASPSFVVALANNLSDFGAMSFSWPPDRMSQLPGLRRTERESVTAITIWSNRKEAIAQEIVMGGKNRITAQ